MIYYQGIKSIGKTESYWWWWWGFQEHYRGLPQLRDKPMALPSLLHSPCLECKMMAGAPGAILEYEVTLRMDPGAEDGKTERWRYHTGPGLSVSGFFLRDGELTCMFAYVCGSQTNMHLN